MLKLQLRSNSFLMNSSLWHGLRLKYSVHGSDYPICEQGWLERGCSWKRISCTWSWCHCSLLRSVIESIFEPWRLFLYWKTLLYIYIFKRRKKNNNYFKYDIIKMTVFIEPNSDSCDDGSWRYWKTPVRWSGSTPLLFLPLMTAYRQLCVGCL